MNDRSKKVDWFSRVSDTRFLYFVLILMNDMFQSVQWLWWIPLFCIYFLIVFGPMCLSEIWWILKSFLYVFTFFIVIASQNSPIHLLLSPLLISIYFCHFPHVTCLRQNWRSMQCSESSFEWSVWQWWQAHCSYLSCLHDSWKTPCCMSWCQLHRVIEFVVFRVIM